MGLVKRFVLLLAAVSFSVTAWTPNPVGSTPPPTTAVSETTSVPTTPATSTLSTGGVDSEAVTVGVDLLSLNESGSARVVPYADGQAVLALVREITGEDPPAVPLAGYDGLDYQTDTFQFDGIEVWVPENGGSGPASVSVTASTLAGVPVRTTEGISVGSSRAAALDAGAREGYDSDQDGVADRLDLGRAEVPDTQSLQTPGATGTFFVSIGLTGDVVTDIQAPSNDFSDI